MHRNVFLALILSSSVAVTALAGGKQANPGVLPPWSHAFGQTYGEWTALWWQWALAQPADVNPIPDPDGDDQAAGQAGKVWFLAGTGGGAAVRSVTVPRGKAILFPVLNNVWVTVEYLGDDPFSVEGAEEFARNYIQMDPAADLQVEVDGKSLDNLLAYRAVSPVFPVYMPPDNWFGINEDIYPDCVSDGYWIMLAPLSKGNHTIWFNGIDTRGMDPEFPGEPPFFTVEVTYEVTVK